jgi:hypothetical protein
MYFQYRRRTHSKQWNSSKYDAQTSVGIKLRFQLSYICCHAYNKWYSYRTALLTLSDPMSDLVRHYDFPVPDAFLDI